MTHTQQGHDFGVDESEILKSRTPSTVVSTLDMSVRQTKKFNEYSARCSIHQLVFIQIHIFDL